MSKLIKFPNLPQGRINGIICGTDDESILDYFKMNNISVLRNEANTDIDPSVASHADMAVLHLGSNKIMADKRQDKLRNELENLGFTVYKTKEQIKGEYPGDIKLNFAVIGDYAIGNYNYCDENLKQKLSAKKQINVKQGYSKCSILIVDEKSAITDDTSIYKALVKNGFDALLISKGDISLKGHGYGFIGGASGKITKDSVLFFGDITTHRDFEEIKEFLACHNCSYICSDNGPLRDIGGIIPLFEE